MGQSFRALNRRAVRRADAEAAVSLAKRRAWFGQTPLVDKPIDTSTDVNWATLLEPGLRARFFEGLTRLPSSENIFDLYSVMSSTKSKEKLFKADGTTMMDVPEYNGAIEYDSPDLPEMAEVTHKEYALGFAVERSLVDDAEYNIIGALATNLGVSFQRTRLRHAARVFDKAFSTDLLGLDGKPLVATDHPVGGSTVSNKGTAALDAEAIIAARTTMLSYSDANDNELIVSPDTIVVPNTLEATAWTIVNSLNAPGNANNDANFVRSLNWKVRVSRFITDPDAWFLVDSQLARQSLYWFNRVLPEFAIDPKGTYDLQARYRGYARWSSGVSDWRFIWGSDGSGGA